MSDVTVKGKPYTEDECTTLLEEGVIIRAEEFWNNEVNRVRDMWMTLKQGNLSDKHFVMNVRKLIEDGRNVKVQMSEDWIKLRVVEALDVTVSQSLGPQFYWKNMRLEAILSYVENMKRQDSTINSNPGKWSSGTPNWKPRMNNNNNTYASRRDVNINQCAYCKEPGHWARDCPKLGKQTPNQGEVVNRNFNNKQQQGVSAPSAVQESSNDMSDVKNTAVQRAAIVQTPSVRLPIEVLSLDRNDAMTVTINALVDTGADLSLIYQGGVDKGKLCKSEACVWTMGYSFW